MMKRILIALLALGLLLALTACAPGRIPVESTSGGVAEPSDSPTETAPPAEPTISEPPTEPDVPTDPTETVPTVPQLTGPAATEPPELPTGTEPTMSEGPTEPAETEPSTAPSAGPEQTVPVTKPEGPKPSAPTVPEPPESAVTVPDVMDPEPTRPDTAPTKPAVTDPPATKPAVTEPPVTKPSATEPPVTKPSATEPPAAKPSATEPPATKPSATEPPVTKPSVTEPQTTKPSATEPPATKPAATEPSPTQCSHRYSLTAAEAASCTSAEVLTYTCEKCGDDYQETVGDPEPHTFDDATCTLPETCSACGATSGDAKGHNYSLSAICNRCGETEPGPIEITVTVKDSKGNKLANVSVSIFMDDPDTPVGTGITGTDGTISIMVDHLEMYQVVLSGLPAGITANSSYTFSSKRANINLKVQPVLNPTDHSRADYRKGSTMADFSLTDTDGNLYTLYELLEEKELVILDFWYCMCTPCKNEFPYFEEALDRYGDRISLLALNPLDSEDAIIDLRRELGSTFPMLRDTVNLYRGFGVTAYPVTVFIDSDGKVLSIHRGAFSSQEQFLNEIEKYLN